MTMSALALLILFDAVKAHFATEAPNVNCVFGWKEPVKTINQDEGGAARITFTPGDSGDSLGDDAPAKYPGRNPRPIGTLKELFRVRVWAVDTEHPNDERAQYEVTRLLYDTVRRALYLCDPGGLSIRSQVWVRNVTERQFGLEIEMTCTVDAMIPDLPWEEAENMRGDAGITMALPSGDIDPNPGPVPAG